MRSSAGITRSLLIIVDSATEATITMPVAAEKPPMKASSAMPRSPYAIGRVSTHASAAPSRTSGMCAPAATIGSTATLTMTRYSGTIQRARARSPVSSHSTMPIWNCRGRQNIAQNASMVCARKPGDRPWLSCVTGSCTVLASPGPCHSA